VLRIRIVLVLGLLMLAGLPGLRPVPSVPAPWAQEAVEWFEARDEAARLGIPNLLRFVAPDVVHDDDSLAEVAVGRAEYGSHLQQDDQERSMRQRRTLATWTSPVPWSNGQAHPTFSAT
jgi:hypothetical protein